MNQVYTKQVKRLLDVLPASIRVQHREKVCKLQLEESGVTPAKSSQILMSGIGRLG